MLYMYIKITSSNSNLPLCLSISMRLFSSSPDMAPVEALLSFVPNRSGLVDAYYEPPFNQTPPLLIRTGHSMSSLRELRSRVSITIAMGSSEASVTKACLIESVFNRGINQSIIGHQLD